MNCIKYIIQLFIESHKYFFFFFRRRIKKNVSKIKKIDILAINITNRY